MASGRPRRCRCLKRTASRRSKSCDRIGCAAPLTFAKDAAWRTLTGNQIGALLADYLLENWKQAGRLTPQHFIVQTLVTTQLIRRIGESYGVRTIGDLLVGFK